MGRLRISIYGVLTFVLAGTVSAALPDMWYSLDIGEVGQPGSAHQADGVWTVNGSGSGIGGQADNFHYCYTQISGDTEIIARVVGITGGTSEWASAGVMIRETLAEDSNHAFMAFTNDMSTAHPTSFQWRSIADSDSNQIDNAPAGYALGNPVWVRIERDGDTIIGYNSMDGKTWNEVGSHTNLMVEDLYIGLAVTSDDNNEVATGTFDNVAINAWPGPVCYPAYNPIPADGSCVGPEYDGNNVYVLLDFWHSPCAFGYWSDGYFSERKADVDNRDEAHYLGKIPYWVSVDDYGFFVVGYDDPSVPEFARAPLVPGKTYYWCVDSWAGDRYIPGRTWSFTPIPKHAWNPSPADGREWVWYKGTMTWNLADVDTTGLSLSYDIYIGTDHNDVNNATTASPEYIENLNTESYEYEVLGYHRPFWRVDTVLGLNRPPFTKTYYTGEVWSFFSCHTPPDYYRVDLHPDGIMNLKDYAVFAADWHETGPDPAMDFSRNGKVNYNDLIVLTLNWLSEVP